MSGYLVGLYRKWKHLLNDKGQGLVEFALTIAFCAFIAYAVSEMGFIEALRGAYNSGNEAYLMADIGGGKTQTPGNGGDTGGGSGGNNGGGDSTDDKTTAGVGPSGFDWGRLDPNTYFEQPYENEKLSLDGGKTHVNFTATDSTDDRLAADQKALENIARFFIGKTRDYVRDNLLKEQYLDNADMGAGDPKNKVVLNLGHFKVADESTSGPGMYFEVTGNDGLNPSQAGNIFKWMVDPYAPGSVKVEDNYNYLVSDYAVSQGWVSSIKAGTQQGNGLKLRLEFDYSGQYAPEGGYKNDDEVIVVGAHVAIDPKSQFNDQLGKDTGNKPRYNRMNSQGLDIQVRVVGVDDKGELFVQVDKKNTGIPLEGDKSATGSPYVGIYNWYGESDYQLVQAFINNKAQAITLGDTSITHDFKKGELIKKGNDWYVYTSSSDKTLTLNKNSNLNDFVKIETNTFRYWHENDKATDGSSLIDNIKNVKNRGTVFTKDNGDVFVYVGKQPPSKGFPVNITDINESNSDWLKIGNLKQSEG